MKDMRQPVARNFYPGDCRKQIERFLTNYKVPKNIPGKPIAAVLPHAGWSYSGATAVRCLFCLAQQRIPDTVIIFGTDHTGVYQHALYPSGRWVTPLGILNIDKKLGTEILNEIPDLIIDAPEAHANEHSIEVLTPMIKYFWPNTHFLPITIKPELSSIDLGHDLGKMLSNRTDVVVLASTDLTHYGSVYGFAPAGLGAEGFRWLHKNDKQMITAVTAGTPAAVLDEARKNRNACGAGAVAALKAFVLKTGHENGHLIEYTTSHGSQSPEEFEYGVGYAGIIF